MKQKLKTILIITTLVLSCFSFLLYAYTGDRDYITLPTNYIDVGSAWSSENEAYDYNNNTNADLNSIGDGNDIFYDTFNISDNSGETITYVDIYMRIDVSGLSNDYLTIKWYVETTQGTGTFEINSGNQASDMLISFEDRTNQLIVHGVGQILII